MALHPMCNRCYIISIHLYMVGASHSVPKSLYFRCFLWHDTHCRRDMVRFKMPEKVYYTCDELIEQLGETEKAEYNQ